MPHPIMFSDDDPVLAHVRRIALALPEATEKIAHGRPTFRCGKMFAVYGGGTRRSATAAHRRFDTSVLFLADPSERTALEQDDRFFSPAYLGPSGWLGLDLSTGTVDWSEVGELLDASFRRIAPARAVRALDERDALH